MVSLDACWKFEVLTRRAFFPCREELREKCLDAIIPSVHRTFAGTQALLHSPKKREWKETKPNRVLWHSLDDKITAKLQELLVVSVGILMGLAIEWAGLHHRDKTRIDLEIFPSSSDIRPNRDIGSKRSRVFTERLLGHRVGCGWHNNDWFACQEWDLRRYDTGSNSSLKWLRILCQILR